ncbi:hypothetical protein [Nocardioides campestrisoli]|uniref:hypothetical protein n=1 Tax=Nocardioides campestrisoli TaxID=2736757 RepID=UPI00163D947E|nr:hypothetical protein [Nocardioides campestrisoli]
MRWRERSGRVRRSAAALLGAGALALLTVSGAAHASTETPEPSSGPLAVDDAVFTWSLNEQTNARSHNPGAINFLAAGVADPGRGGAILPSSKWQATAGPVTIQKRDGAGAWRTATWAGLSTDATGAPIDIYGPFSGHRVHIGAGTGTLDPVAEDATLAWSGTFTVVYYGGNTVFTVTDPVLEVRGGTGTLTAQLGGWDADRNDPTLWSPVPPQRVTVTDLAGVDVTETGLVATPAYAGVQVDGTVPQSRTGESWGSFPPAMIAFLAPLGVDQFWYSTGLQSDWTKLPAPVVVGYGGGEPPAEPVPSASAKPSPKPNNEVVKPPRRTPTPKPAPARTPAAAPVPVSSPVVAAPSGGAAVPPAAADDALGAVGAVGAAANQPVVVSAATVSPALAPASAAPGTHPGWWIGGLLLLAAAALLLVPVRTRP